jgi:hypothetical protein
VRIILSKWEKFKDALWTIEIVLTTKVARILKYLKWIKTAEVATGIFTLAILLLVGVAILCLNVHHFDEGFLESLEKPAEIISSGLNFIGVMFIANGVMLSRAKKKELLDLLFFPFPYRKAVRTALLEASNSCEKGMLLVIVGFVFDMVSKLAFSPVAHCIK